MRRSPYAELPIVIRMPGGFRWYLAQRDWEGAARLANGQRRAEGSGAEGAEILRKARRRLVFRLNLGRRGLGPATVVVKAHRMESLKRALFRHSRYGPQEIGNLLEATRRGVPVPRVYGYGQGRSGILVRDMMIIMEDMASRKPVGELLAGAGGCVERQKEIMARAGRLLVGLYEAGCNHIDTNGNALWIDEDESTDDRIIDFHYACFLDKPSPMSLMSAAAVLWRSCRESLAEELFEGWLKQLSQEAKIGDFQTMLRECREFVARDMTRAQRLAIR